ncbi:hypothetical protein [Oceanospirillum sp.]|uniref:hypothetical protein n=1 Tax=Oceanospirillum sp. TaxID=2021254 RepID=UPI003A8D6763
MAQEKVQFQSSASALRALKVGKRNPNWVDAAEYLINKASPEVKLLLEAAREIERQKMRGELPGDSSEHKVTTSLFSPAQWVIMGLVGVVFTGLLIWIAVQIGVAAC